MKRGYLKLWRRMEDSVTWSRGLEYRGLMCSILLRTNRLKTVFRGVEIQPGSFGVVLSSWCEELGISRQKLQRMSIQLVNDDFISMHSPGNRFTVIKVLNWDRYQHVEGGNAPYGKASFSSSQMSDAGSRCYVRRAAAELTEQEYKNIIQDKNINRARAGNSNCRMESRGPLTAEQHEQRNKAEVAPGNGYSECPDRFRPSHGGFKSCFAVYPVQKAEEPAWREWCRLEDNGLLPAVFVIRDAITLLSQEDKHWLDGCAPKFANWLRDKGWNDKPYNPGSLPKTASKRQSTENIQEKSMSPQYNGMRINSVAQGIAAENDMLARQMLTRQMQEKERINNDESTAAIGTC